MGHEAKKYLRLHARMRNASGARQASSLRWPAYGMAAAVNEEAAKRKGHSPSGLPPVAP
jgi:hypothetical protein